MKAPPLLPLCMVGLKLKEGKSHFTDGMLRPREGKPLPRSHISQVAEPGLPQRW